MNICYKLISHVIFYMFRAFKAYNQEYSCNNTDITV